MKNPTWTLDQPLAVTRPVTTLALGSVLFAFLTAAGAAVSFPMIPVPVTLQTLFVVLSGAVLGPVFGPLSQILYLTAGVAGMPVFAGGAAGPGVIAGPTGGYLVGFVIAAWVAGLTTRAGASWLRLGFGLLLAHAVIFLFGASHLRLFLGSSWENAFRLGVAPFLPGMLVKTGLAAASLRGRRLLGWFRP